MWQIKHWHSFTSVKHSICTFLLWHHRCLSPFKTLCFRSELNFCNVTIPLGQSDSDINKTYRKQHTRKSAILHWPLVPIKWFDSVQACFSIFQSSAYRTSKWTPPFYQLWSVVCWARALWRQRLYIQLFDTTPQSTHACLCATYAMTNEYVSN